jgi:5'-nucleotidase
VNNAIRAGYPAGKVIDTRITDDETDSILRIAFDFDGVIADDAAEMVFKTQNLESFQESETQLSLVPHNPGPLQNLFTKISHFQQLETQRIESEPGYQRNLKISIVTARKRILEILKPHIYFDDQTIHLEHIDKIPLVHIPFGVANISG